MTLNENALQHFEENEYDKALDLLEQAVGEKRTLQSLTNLAWMYLNEEEDPLRAKPLLEEVAAMHPHSHFPYNMLGEIALQEEDWESARTFLNKSLAIHSSREAIHNLAVADFHTGRFQEAADGFQVIAEDSDIVSWYEVIARIRNNEEEVAKSILGSWNSESDHYLGSLWAADTYVEMGCLQEARAMYEKEWAEYVVSPEVVARYAYVLWQLQDVEACRQVIDDAAAAKRMEIEDMKQEICDAHWTEADKRERVEELVAEWSGLRRLFAKLQEGFKSPFEIELHQEGGCYLFGCKQHGHPEWA